MPNDKRNKAAHRSARGGRQFSAGKPSRPTQSASSSANTVAQAKRSYERYIALARDAASAGDAIESENYYQHAEHYLRTMREHAEGRSAGDERSAFSKGVPAS